MRLSELRRVSTFRLTLLYGVIVAIGMIALLGVIYLQSAVYLTRRVDTILSTEADALVRPAPSDTARRIGEALTLDGDQSNIFALFANDGHWLAGNIRAKPKALEPGGAPVEAAPTADFPAYARLIARRLPTGQVLVVGRDINQLREMRAIIASALVWSGGLTFTIMIALATLLSLAPLRRLSGLKLVSDEIAAGDLKKRLPMSSHNAELDMLAATVNAMMDEIERLLTEVRGVSEIIAHDLRAPLTRVRAQLYRLQQSDSHDSVEMARAVGQIDIVLERFRALMRISELEARHRRAGFAATDLARICREVVELYAPLADATGVRLATGAEQAAVVEADPKLLFEALSNLVDNAIKFAGEGKSVEVSVDGTPQHPVIVVQDDGPGIAASEKSLVLQRLYRGEQVRREPGSGLGLSIVVSIVRLHRFRMNLLDANPGLRVEIDCTSGLTA